MGRHSDGDRVPMRTKVTTEEYDEIYAFCQAHGMKSGEFLRDAVLQVMRERGLTSLRRLRTSNTAFDVHTQSESKE